MAINDPYRSTADLPAVIPVFPLLGALLLPRGEIPLNVFEPRYLAMLSDALRGTRLIGVIQPDPEAEREDEPRLMPVGCLGRITAFSEVGDGRCLMTLTGVIRFRVDKELSSSSPYRCCRVDYAPYEADLTARAGEEDVDRTALLRTLATYLEENELQADWDSVERAPLEALVNGLAMMSPYGPREKQAFLEAPDLRTRADMLVAVAEMELARSKGETTPSLQ
jgi:Lon protease-like protein